MCSITRTRYRLITACRSLAIGRMFGGIPEPCFTTYHEYRPKSEPKDQYDLRQDLYQLYHYLNHTVLFGVCLPSLVHGEALLIFLKGGYAGDARRKMDTLLREVLVAEK